METLQKDVQRPPWRRRAQRGCALLALLLGLLAAAFCANALCSDWERPAFATTKVPPRPPLQGELRVLAYNLEKADLFASTPIRDPAELQGHLDRIAALIREANPDLVLLSEVVAECTPCPVDQVRYLAEATGMHAWAFGEQYNFGLPIFRIRGGNAVLSRLPMRPLVNLQLVGGTSILWPANNRRALWCELKVHDSWLRVAAIHNDSFDAENNTRQVRQLLRFMGEGPALLGGDFNAQPTTESMTLLAKSARFSGLNSSAPTFPSDDPTRRIDYVLAPGSWEVISQEVLVTTLSDHRPVLSVFRLPSPADPR